MGRLMKIMLKKALGARLSRLIDHALGEGAENAAKGRVGSALGEGMREELKGSFCGSIWESAMRFAQIGRETIEVALGADH